MGQLNPFNPGLADGIRRLGFRKWYERELLSSHARMALTLLVPVCCKRCGFRWDMQDG